MTNAFYRTASYCCAIALVSLGWVSPLLAQQKDYRGFFSDPIQLCNTREGRGWFYWYVDANGECTIVRTANREEAERRSQSILANSFHVVRAGYGFRDEGGEPLRLLPEVR
ncbi:hypothetical protein IQ249_15965 [Lusitaniella coriacea LEGE 07157]|uniref:Uncharacterized protein n=1 Tax=Lusitaniella coriacea LEGE 07157 TaxID=945747 RepID=A0A8J7DXV8_9CYAN|nr:hypothetical protein [Lusitaniella coriacea]MBE9117396.1 hypothetical protein [Lusitaniella coriacea LEGE 07157]